MKRIAIFCFALFSVVSVGDAVICFATIGCPGNDTLCILNCSEIAVNDFNQPALHGNCRTTLTVEGDTFQGCYIHVCNTSHPEMCVGEIVGDHVGAECCCTRDLCNTGIVGPLDNATQSGDNTDGNNHTTHIYPTYPTHVAEDELVCAYQDCSIDDCGVRYEVCSENPIYANVTVGRHICHAVLIVDTKTGSFTLNQHCFDDGHSTCTEECIPKLHTAVSVGEDALYDCCCTGRNLCNNITFTFTGLPSPTISTSPTTTTNMTVDPTSSSSSKNNDDNVPVIYGVVIGMSLLILLVLIVIVVLFYCYYLEKSKNNRHQTDQLPTELINSPTSLAPVEGIDNVELIKQVGRGRFATVWKAVMNDSSVAIKIFPVFNVESYSHERDIYTTPFFDHDCLLHFIGAEQRTVGYETQYWLVTAYHEYGSLLDFLRVRTVSLENLCMMAESIAMGLSHLHCTFTRNGRYKPAIVHRDFKSKNVLVKEDLTCAISDFGLAFKFVSGESPVEAQGQVGTTRYMSPEVLEGAVNFQREAFMRIDMYACGLVLWEITTRCIVDGTNPGEYMQPFEDELKGNPSIEMMKQVVIAAKKRPEFPIAFNVNSQLESLVTTITECWDDDAEARLSAKTVEERIKSLRRDICKPPIIDNEKDVGLMVSLTPSQSMPVFPGKELSSGISCSLPNSYSTLTSPRSNASLTFSPKLTDRNQNNVFPETSSPTRLTNGYITDCYPLGNGHTPHSQLMNSNGNNHKTIPVHSKGLPSRANGHVHSFSETTL